MRQNERTLILVLIALFVLTCIGCEGDNTEAKNSCYERFLITDKCLSEVDNG